MRRPPLLPHMLLLATLVAPFATPREARAGDHPVLVPTGIAVQVDGRLQPAEWQDALELALGHPTATLRIKQYRGTLMVAFDAAEHWIDGSELILYFAPDHIAKDLGAWSDRALTIRFEPLDHDRPHLIVTRQEGQFTQRLTGEVVAEAALDPSSASAELAFSSGLLGVSEPSDVLRMAVMWVRPGSRDRSATLPEGLDVGAQPGSPPADLASRVNWLKLSGIADLDQPGAYSPAQWAEWVEAENEITRRGDAAYALYREMDEERRHYKKQDGLVNEVIVEGLRWISEREPLTNDDRLLLARVYTQTNRALEAIAILDGLAGSRDKRVARSALYERAKALGNIERFAEAAASWNRLAANSGAHWADRYRIAAADAEERIPAWTHEQAMRVEDDAKRLPLVELRTNRGRVVIQLQPDDVPKAVAHFTTLVRAGFYDGLHFHRVIGEFLAQTGDPITRGGDCTDGGRGSSDAKVEIEENLRHGLWRGAVGFAVGMVQENGSQFFLLTGPRPDLMDEQTYTVFGRVVSGMDVMDRIEYCDKVLTARVLREDAKATTGSPKDADKDK